MTLPRTIHGAVGALARAYGPGVVSASGAEDGIHHVSLELRDGSRPLYVDLVAAGGAEPRRTTVLLSASGTSFASSFLLPGRAGLAPHLARRGDLVVGVTPREAGLEPGAVPEGLAGWDVFEHAADVRAVLSTLAPEVRGPVTVVGHSFSGATALAVACEEAARIAAVAVLELFAIVPSDAEDRARSARVSAALDALISSGAPADTSLADLRALIFAADVDPDADSGVPRALASETAAGSFTRRGLLHFWLVHTGGLPGVHTARSGLPRDWPLVDATLAGRYELAPDPREDTYAFTHTDAGLLPRVARAMGSGTIPLALMRDWYAQNAGAGAVPDIGRLRAPLVWINAELGYGPPAGAGAIAPAADLRTVVVRGYGNADVLYARDAARDVWAHLPCP